MCAYNRVNVSISHQSIMGGSASKPEPAVKGDGVTTVDNSFSVVNIHVTTVVYMSIVVVLVIAIVALVYIYVKTRRLTLLPATSPANAATTPYLQSTTPSIKKALPARCEASICRGACKDGGWLGGCRDVCSERGPTEAQQLGITVNPPSPVEGNGRAIVHSSV